MSIIKKPTWQEYVPKNKYPKLEQDLTADVVIVGGGLTGILACYKLTVAGYKVVLLEAEDGLAQGATLYTTACATQVIDTDIHEARAIYGDRVTKLIWRSHGEAIDAIEEIVHRERIDCSFKRCPNYVFASSERQASQIINEAAAYKELDFKAKLWAPGEGPSIPHFGCLEIPNQAKFNPILFASAVAQRAREKGARIFCNSKVAAVTGTGPLFVETDSAMVTARNVIIATYKPLTQEGTRFKKGMYVSYVFEVEVPKNMFPEAIYEDLSNPYNYFRVYNGGAKGLMILGGQDHRVELSIDPRRSFTALKKVLARLMGGREYTITRQWTGQILEPSDGLALIGKISPHYYVASAFSGNGMTYAMIAGSLLTDLIDSKANFCKRLYDPLRVPTVKQLFFKGRDYTHELFIGGIKNLLTAPSNR